MKITKPREVVEVCDICRRGGFLQTCVVCGQRYCLTCHHAMSGSWVSPDICEECAKRDDVIAMVARYAKQITPIIKKRTAALVRLGKKPGKTAAKKQTPLD